MRTMQEPYPTLRTQTGSFYEIEVLQGNRVYGLGDLFELKISPKLFDGSGPSIGNTYSSVCEMTLKETSANWPRMAAFTVRMRLSSADGEIKSDWLPMGTYYTDERLQDEAAGKLHIIAYDGMLLTEQYWTDAIAQEDRPESWPITCKAWTDLMEDAGLIEIDSRSVIDETIPMIGLDTANTVRDVLKTIAAAHGGNWVMTFENKLRLVPFVNADIPVGQVAIAGIAIAGIAIVGKEDYDLPGGFTDYQNLNMRVQSLDTSPELPAIVGVHLETDAGTVMEAGDAESDEGYVIQGTCNPANTSGVAELCLGNLSGYVYKPFEAGRTLLDPAAEIGDIVIIGGISYQMMDIEWSLGTWPVADLSAAYDEEVDHEYKVVSEQGKNYRKLVKGQEELGKQMTEISQTESAFEVFVGTKYETKEDSDRKDDELNSKLTEFGMHYKFTETGEIIGHDGSNKSIRLSNDGIHMMVEEEAVVVITQNEMYAPRKVAIPLSGSLQMGNFLFQPRSSGNMSLFWVGES